MRMTFAILGILLIASGAILLGAPYAAEMLSPGSAMDQTSSTTRSFEKQSPLRPHRATWIDQVRSVAEKANAPLSIIFGFMSLYYTRRTFHAQSQR